MSLGVCVTCGKIRDRASLTCGRCTARLSATSARSRKKKLALGKCTGCLRADRVAGKKQCARCADVNNSAAKKRKSSRLANGLCQIDARPIVTGKNCLECWFSQGAMRHLKKRKLGVALHEMMGMQEWRCAISGDVLLPGKAHLDHKVPTSRGGANDLANLQWVSPAVNQMKHNLTTEELMEACAKIAARHEKEIASGRPR